MNWFLKQSTLIKIIVVGVSALVFLCICMAGLGMIVPREPKETKRLPAYLTRFVVLKEADALLLRFSLEDREQHEVAHPGVVTVKVWDSVGKLLYQDVFSVEKEDFKTYKLVLTGEEFLAYAWAIPLSEVKKGIGPGVVEVIFEIPEDSSWKVEETYVEIPELSEQEIVQLYEEQYAENCRSVNKTKNKDSFSITLERLGHFTHLEYGTWGHEVTYFRIDLSVTNIGSEPEYLFTSDIVVLDDLGNQYDEEYGGSLELGEVYPGVTRKGYVLFPVLDKNAVNVKILISKCAYPEDIRWEFIAEIR